MNITFKITGDAEVKAQLQAIGRQAPYAVSLALNETANAAQNAIRATLPGRFTLRRADFIRNTIYRKPGLDFATKGRLSAAVRIHDERNFLAQHEEGATKTPRSGHTVAIPMPGIRRNKNDIITKANRPRQLLDKKGVRRVDLPGRSLIVKDTRGRGEKGGRSDILYILKPSVRIRPRLGFHETAGRAISASWPVAVENAIVNALLTAR